MYLPEDEEPARYRSKPKPKQWCRGKEGREHKPIYTKWWNMACQFNKGLRYSCYHEQTCEVCGKILNHRVPMDKCPEFGKAVMEYDRRA